MTKKNGERLRAWVRRWEEETGQPPDDIAHLKQLARGIHWPLEHNRWPYIAYRKDKLFGQDLKYW